ncbi:unnamed protein product (macronuclear) [Paramecium tetraurelia]|uniref:Transmembrane protein n=1 Tax=Paramecium tetraurelia TaxID=5888 RepID=A0DSW9_PARTE|nr:uncharacterized protein GSPATT00019829001 [Paramecium tetraurelia]CAK86136.1 unnamed protein product [Paramecium tetraurelia]|eukprot:XP_001453533.1 hypothetical protein (macronuclear) [Paramecium tetraurelia strain d4-2]
MIKKTFFGISLRDKQKYTFKEQNGLLCYTFTQIVLVGTGEAKIYGLSSDKKIQIASLNGKHNQSKCKFIMDENNFTHLICLGDESISINVLGYKLENKVQEQQENNQQENSIFRNEFRALQPQEERELETKGKEVIQKNIKSKIIISKVLKNSMCCDILKFISLNIFFDMFRSISKWRMRNQLKLYFLLLSLFSTLFIGIILIVTQNLVYQKVVLTTQQISTKLTENEISNQFETQMQLFFEVINKNYRALDKFAQLFTFVQLELSLITSKSDQCPVNQTQNYRKSNICYNILNLNSGQELNSIQQQDLQLHLKHQSLLQELLLLFDPEQFIIGNWSIGSGKQFYFSAYQAIGYYSTFNIATRPFYLNHIKKANTSEYIFSDVFYNFENEYKVTISKNLTNDITEGIVATQFEFQIIKKFFQGNFLILNKDGLILIGNVQMYFQPNRTNVYFFNETLTGFNENDWNSVRVYMDYNISESNCTTSNSLHLCRYNKITLMDVMIFAKFLRFSNLILIILKNIEKDEDLERQLIWIEEQKNLQITQLLTYQLIAALVISLTAILVVRYICRYMTYLERLAHSHFQNKPVDFQVYSFLREIKLHQQSHSTNITLNLSDSYYRLISQLNARPFIKNDECKNFESFQFPSFKKKFNLLKWKSPIQELHDSKGTSRPSCKALILNLLRKSYQRHKY